MDVHSKATIFGSVLAVAAAVAGCTAYFTWRNRCLPASKKTTKLAKLKVDRSKVHVVSTEKDWEKVLQDLRADLDVLKVLGVDCEWVGTNPIALLQIASHTGLCILIRLQLLKHVPDTLKSILSDKGILKVGVAVYDDSQRLAKDHALCMRGCVDLRYLALRSSKYELRHYGLKDLAEGILKVTLEKGAHIRCSDWQAQALSKEQIDYAAGDAVVAIQLYSKFIQDKLSTEAGPHSERDVRQKSLSLCQGIVDVQFSLRAASGTKRMGGGKRPKDLFKPVTRAYTTRNKPLYHNCQLWAPDGQLLCTCDVKKALWYIDKGLGEKVNDEPLTVQLKFEPSGRPLSQTNYYLQEKENRCVVCGRPDSYTKKNIVPHEYRKHFPSLMKDHKSHDVVLMCIACHQQSSRYDADMRLFLEKKCEAPLGSSKSSKYKQDHTLSRLRSAAKALNQSGSNIPVERRHDLEKVVKEYYQVDDISEDVLERAAKLDTKLLNESYTSHGEKVVAYMMENEGLVAFERMWRQHFLDSMSPKFLPPLWSVDHSHERLASLNLGFTGVASASK